MADLASHHTGNTSITPAARTRDMRTRDNGGKSVVAFICGLVGLLVGNLLLGPVAIGLGIAALRGANPRRGRAVLGIAPGVADLVLFAVLAVHSGAGHGVLWKFGS